MHKQDRQSTQAAAWAVLAALALAPGAAVAQEAAISGTVTDATGLVLPGVTIEARSTAAGGQVMTAFTNGAGAFAVAGLQPGAYDVTFSLPGFTTVVRENVSVRTGAAVTLDVELAIFLEERVVVVGSRAQPRSVLESSVPVDVLASNSFVSQGDTDFTNQLRAVVPSFNVATQPISDAASIVRPANLRNLAPDHTLVLVNGKRRHRAAVITWLGNGVADGAQGPDISVIPSIALRQVEVLRDGAAAQYGSDAIAGVLNLQLKDARSGGSVEFRTGLFGDANSGSEATCGTIGASCNGIEGRGESYTFAGNVGLPLGRTGFANLSLEYGNVNPTNRAVQRDDAAALIAAGNTNVRDTAQVWGAPKIEDDLKVFGNFGYVFDNGLSWYAHTNYASKKVTGGFYFRNPNTRGSVFSLDRGRTLLVGDVLAARGMGSAGCPTVAVADAAPDPAAFAAVRSDPNCFTFHEPFAGAPNGLPGGFTPQFGGDVDDGSIVTGVRGYTSGGLTWDASVNWGRNSVDTFIFDTVNASLGPESPTAFRPNLLQQTDVGVNLDLSYVASDMINLAGGAEWRREQYHLGAGDPASWEIGPYAAQGFSSGSNGYNGTRPENAGTWNRSNVAVYGDVEVHGVTDRWTLGLAVRLEDFDTFGTTMNSKISGRYAVTDRVSVRGATSSGFRAPTPGQQNAFNVTTLFDPGVGDLVNNGTIPSTSPAAALRGGQPLAPETSINYSVGSVIDADPFTLTADYFRIDVEDRLTLTRRFQLTAAETSQLIAGGFAEAANLQEFRFFVNDFSTRTQGIDVVSTYAPPALGGATVFSAVFNYTDTKVTEWTSDTIDADRRSALERGLPETRWNFGVNHTADRWSLMARLSFYGQYWDGEDAINLLGSALSYTYPLYSGKALLDAELGIPVGDSLSFAVGGQNILNTYPEAHPNAAAGVGNQYGQFSPFGFGGAYYYVRVNYAWSAVSF